MKKIQKVVIPSAGPTTFYRSVFQFYSKTLHRAVVGGRVVFEVCLKGEANG